jgi:phosphatidylserine/phosphatidylglycerophosphate/cardiolipin synthase-like enzyme
MPPLLHPHLFALPWRAGNHVTLLVDGPAFFARMLEAIETAQHYVLLEMYLFESGTVASRFIEALARAAARGVAVHVLVDGFGVRRLARGDRRRLRTSGVQLALYNPLRARAWWRNLMRDHRKQLLVDGRLVFVTGAGLTDEFDSPQGLRRTWRETAVAVEGPAVADWYALFARTWARYGRTPLPPFDAPAPVADGSRARVAAASGPVAAHIKRAMLRAIHKAQRRVWFQTAYFVPSRKLRRALRHAARRGVDVRLFLPGPRTDHPAVRHAGRRYYGRLLRAGIRIFEYQPRVLHAKAVLCDDWASLGSSNFDRWNWRWNLDANLEVDDARFADAVAAMLEADRRESREITYSEWRLRPWLSRVRERFWGRVDLWLNRFGRGRDGADVD